MIGIIVHRGARCEIVVTGNRIELIKRIRRKERKERKEKKKKRKKKKKGRKEGFRPGPVFYRR
jgi:hypothetical protein